MIVHQPVLEKRGDRIRVSADIEVETLRDCSDTLWYEFDEKYEEDISTSSNGFVAAMLFLAMYLGEDIRVTGSMSPKLALNLKEFQRYFNFWHPEDFKIVKVRCDEFETEQCTPEGVMCTFSGGVDSFYTLRQHLPGQENDPRHQLTHCLLIDGFAIPRTEELNKSYQLIREKYGKLAARIGIDLVFVATNVADFYQGKLHSYQTDGPVLTSAPLILGRLISAFHIAADCTYAQMLPWGTNAVTTSLLSTEKLTVTLHGSEKSRGDKTLAIIDWPETYDNLRVCWEDFGVKNCCRCEKCVRTMITLEAAGVLSRYKTFSLALDRNRIRSWRLYRDYNFGYAKEILEIAKSRGMKDIVFDVKYAILRSKIKNKMVHLKWSKTYKKFEKFVKGDNTRAQN